MYLEQVAVEGLVISAYKVRAEPWKNHLCRGRRQVGHMGLGYEERRKRHSAPFLHPSPPHFGVPREKGIWLRGPCACRFEARRYM